MAEVNYGTLVQLDAKLSAEVYRLHDDTKGRHGLIELSEDEATALLSLVKEAREAQGDAADTTETSQLPLEG